MPVRDVCAFSLALALKCSVGETVCFFRASPRCDAMGAWGRSRLWMRCLSRCQAANFAAPAIARPVERWDVRPLAAMLTVAFAAEQARRTKVQSHGCVGCASTQRVSLGQVTEFEDASMREVKIEGGAAVLVHRHQGEFFVTSPACGHYGAPLRKGISSAGGRDFLLKDATPELRPLFISLQTL